MNDDPIYDKALKITQSNTELYDRWESAIAAYMAQRWKEAFELAAQVSGSDKPTVMEAADMGADAINDEGKFLGDLREVFRTLAKGCQLNSTGEWC